MEEVIDQIEAEMTPTTSVTAAISPEPRKATDPEEEAAPEPTPSNVNNLTTTDRDIERLNQTDVYWSLDTLVRTWTTTGEMVRFRFWPTWFI